MSSIQYFKLDLKDPDSQAVLDQLEAEFHKVYPANVFSVNVSEDGNTAWAKGVTFDPKAACVKDTAGREQHSKVAADCDAWKSSDVE